MRRVVVTGMGAVTPVAPNVEGFISALIEGRSGVDLLKRFNPASLPTRYGAEVKEVDDSYRDVKISFALKSINEALTQAFRETDFHTCHAQTQLFTGLGLELFSMPDLISEQRSPRSPSEFTSYQERVLYMSTPSDLVTHLVSYQHKLTRPPETHISACSASTDAIGSAFRAISSGQITMAIAGGTDSMLNPMGLGGFCRIGALSMWNDRPQQASRPFDRDRAGFVLGEGAGFLILEEESVARARGASILATLHGYGNSLDAYNISDPHPEGRGAYMAMKRCLQSAGLDSSQIDFISSHGTGTPKNDPAEAAAIRALLGDRTKMVPIMATKSLIGHLISAGGAVETIAAIGCMNRGVLHATANLENVAKDCEHLDHLFANRSINARFFLKNSFAFGGQNSCLLFGK